MNSGTGLTIIYPEKKESWTQYVSKLNSNTPITHVWNRLRKISGKDVCSPKQYLNGKDGVSITRPKVIANEHAAAFADNSSSAHYSTKFQTIKAHNDRARIDFTSDNTDVYNNPFRLRDLRRSILKAKPRAPGPDGIHNNLLKYLPEDIIKIIKEILNNIWISGDFPPQWRAATVIPIPKRNKDHTNPLSYRPIALTSCLCKVLERMINTRLIWFLEKYGILDKSQCGFKKHRSTMDHLVSLERYVRDAFARKQQAMVSFLIWRKPTRLRGNMVSSMTYMGLVSEADCLFLWVPQGPPNSSPHWDYTLWWILSRRRSTSWWCPGCYMLRNKD